MHTRLFILALLLVTVFTPAHAQRQEHQRGLQERHHRLDTLSLNETGQSRYSIEKLTDEVQNFPNMYRLPVSFKNQYREVLVNGEEEFTRGQHPGITDEDIATLHNHLARQLNLPDHARTTLDQVRFLRSKLAEVEPHFMGRGMTNRQWHNPRMSPLQATHLLSVLYSQKLLNPNYQKAPHDWQPDQIRLLDLAGTNFQNERGLELDRAIKSSLGKMTQDEQTQTWHESLRSLHLEN